MLIPDLVYGMQDEEVDARQCHASDDIKWCQAEYLGCFLSG